MSAALLTFGLLLVAILSISPFRGRFFVLSGLLGLGLATLPLLLELFAARHLPADAPYARSSVGAGFWSLLFLLSLMLVEVFGRLKTSRGLQTAMWLLVLGGWIVTFRDDGLESLSLVREFNTRPDEFWQALRIHLALAGGAVGVSLIFALWLAVTMIRRPGWQRPVLAMVSFLQTIPSLALFGLLIAPLSALSAAFPALKSLGIHGIGWAPAVLALIAYSLLPMVRNTFVALTEVPESTVDAGRGMGMTERQLFMRVKLPLALPVMIEGVRITTIQAIGLTAVAALIGAGGFGTFIFQGLGQAAMDLVLLGALPTIFLALVADALFSILGASLTFTPASRDSRA
ncbi:ABC transporter permease [Marinobacter sp. 1Y8]